MRYIIPSAAVAVSILATMLSACASPTRDDSVGASSEALFGSRTFPACGADQQAQLNAALDYLVNRTLSNGFSECLEEAFGVEGEGRSPEQVYADMTTIWGVQITCANDPCDGAAACASPSTSIERVTVRNDWVLSASVEYLGAVLLHEIAHNHSYFHDHFYGPTWPDQVLECALDDDPWGNRRRDLGDVTALAHVGGDGGQPATHECGHEEAMVGLHGAVDSTGRVTRIAPLCQHVDGHLLTGAVQAAPLSLPRGSTPFEDRCGAGEVLVEIRANADSLVHGVRAFCAPLMNLRSPSLPVEHHALTRRGDWHRSGIFTVRACQNRKVGVGLRTREGAVLDRFELLCDDFPLGRRRLETVTWSAGGSGGSPFELRCEGHAALTGIYGQREGRNLATSDIRTVGGICRPLSHGLLADDSGWTAAVHYTEYAGTRSREEELGYQHACPAGQVLVGLEVAHDANRVRRLGTICASWSDWTGSTPTASGSVPRLRGETVTSLRCDFGWAAVAIAGRAGAHVDQVSLRCAEPDGSGSLNMMVAQGGVGGREWSELCPQSRPLTGLWTRTDGDHLWTLTGQCGRSTWFGTSNVDGVRLPTRTDHGPTVRTDCAFGDVLVGLDVGVDGPFADAVRPVCADEADIREGNSPAPTSLAWLGDTDGSAGTIRSIRCPAGQVVRGLRGRRASWQDAVGLICGNVILEDDSTITGVVGPSEEAVWPLLVPKSLSGSWSISVASSSGLTPRIRLRRAHHPTSSDVYMESTGVAGGASINGTGLPEDLWYVSVDPSSGSGAYYLSIDLPSW